MTGAGIGHSYRTKDESNAKAFMAEKRNEREQLRAARERRRSRIRRFTAALRRVWRKIRG